jgi:flagellar biosynthesis regulator FlaF
MTTKQDKEVLIRTMREYMKEDGDLIDELDQRLSEATSQLDEALERIDALVYEVEQWKRIAMDYAFDETE